MERVTQLQALKEGNLPTQWESDNPQVSTMNVFKLPQLRALSATWISRPPEIVLLSLLCANKLLQSDLFITETASVISCIAQVSRCSMY